MTAFLLVHGAFRGGWAWRRVRPLLVAAGYDVHAPSLLGCGERADLVEQVTGLDSWVGELERLVLAEDLDDLVLVGHSQGGVVATALAGRIADRLRCVVHLDAAVPEPGERALDLGPGGAPEPARDLLVPPRPLLPDPDGGLDEATVAWMNARLTPVPVAPSLDPVPGVSAGVREVFAFCSETPPGYPSQLTRARLDGRGTPYRVLRCGHDAPLAAPGPVAELLLEAAGHTVPAAAPQQNLAPTFRGS